MTSLKLPLAGALIASFFGCKTSSTMGDSRVQSEALRSTVQTSLGIGMNDVSIMLPYMDLEGKKQYGFALSKTAPSINDKPDPSAWAQGLPHATLDGEGFVSKKLLDQMEAFQQSEGVNTSPDDLSQIKLVSIRIVPCANELTLAGDVQKCLSTMQLVWQTLGFIDEGISQLNFMDDRNIHAIYVLKPDELKAAIATLKDMHAKAKLKTEDLPLQPSPAIIAEGVDGQYLKSALGLVHRYARSSKLFGLSSLRTFGRNNVWNMAQGQVVAGSFVNVPVPTTKTISKSQTFDLVGNSFIPEGVKENVATVSPFKLPQVSTLNLEDLEGKEKAREQKTFATFITNAHAIDNPSMHNIQNLDCASCHRAPLSPKLAQSFPTVSEEMKKHQFKSDRWNLTNLTDIHYKKSALQMFSFASEDPKVSQRVINETAEALHFLEKYDFLK